MFDTRFAFFFPSSPPDFLLKPKSTEKTPRKKRQEEGEENGRKFIKKPTEFSFLFEDNEKSFGSGASQVLIKGTSIFRANHVGKRRRLELLARCLKSLLKPLQ